MADPIDRLFLGILEATERPKTLIACLTSSSCAFEYISPMPRTTIETNGFPLDSNFLVFINRAIAENPAVHDGAVVFSFEEQSGGYLHSMWSGRLHAPPYSGRDAIDKGSAFNSAISSSHTEGVDAVYLISEDKLWRFSGGRFKELSS